MNCSVKALFERSAVSSSRRSTGFSIARKIRSVKLTSSTVFRPTFLGGGGSTESTVAPFAIISFFRSYNMRAGTLRHQPLRNFHERLFQIGGHFVEPDH